MADKSTTGTNDKTQEVVHIYVTAFSISKKKNSIISHGGKVRLEYHHFQIHLKLIIHIMHFMEVV